MPVAVVNNVGIVNKNSSLDETRHEVAKFKGVCIFNGQVLQDGMNLDMEIDGEKYTGILDSGSNNNLIDAAVYHLWRQKHGSAIVWKQGSLEKLLSFEGNRVCSLYEIRISLRFEGLVYDVDFYIFPTVASKVIFGTSFLYQIGATFQFVLDGDPHYAKLISDIWIDRRTSVIVNCEVDRFGDLGKQVEAEENTLSHLWIPAHYDRLTSSGNIKLIIVNDSNRGIYLKKGQNITTVKPYNNIVNAIKLSEIGVEDTLEDQEIVQTSDWKLEYKFEDSELSLSQQKDFIELVNRKRNAFVAPDGKLGYTDWIEHDMELKEDAVPRQQMPFRLNPEMKKHLQTAVQKQIDLGFVEPTMTGEWASPAFLVAKKDGTYRLVVDFRQVNSYTKTQFMAIPLIEETIDAIGQVQPKYLTSLDLCMCFHQIPISERSKDYSAFVTHFGRFRYRTMPMGLKNAARTCQVMMDLVLRGIKYKNVVCYMDDILIYSHTFEQHLKDVEEVLDRLIHAGLKIKLEKCKFATSEVLFLGHVINQEGIKPNPKKVQIIKDIQRPETVTQVRRFLGLTGYFRRYIPNYSLKARALYELTKHDVKIPFEWSEEKVKAFETLKTALTNEPLLLYPHFDREFTVVTDASNYGIGCVLLQKDSNERLRPVAYAGKIFTDAQKRYATLDKELCAIIFALQHWRVYLIGKHFTLYTDHAPLTYVLNPRSKLTTRQIRWASEMREFDFTCKHIKGKENIPADALSRLSYDKEPGNDALEKNNSQEKYELFETFPDLTISDLCYDENKNIKHTVPRKQRKEIQILNNILTKNDKKQKVKFQENSYVREFKESDLACSYIRMYEEQLRQDYGKSYDDSEVVNAVLREGTVVKDNRMRKKFSEAERNQMLITLGYEKDEIVGAQREDAFCSAMVNFLKEGTLTDSDVMNKVLLYTESWYIIIGELLYRIVSEGVGKSMNKNILCLVLPLEWRNKVMQQYHDNPLAGHLGFSKTLAVIKRNYYWRSMNKDVQEYCSSCEKCLQTKRPTRPINPSIVLREPVPRPWDTIFLDCLEKLPITREKNRHIVVIVDQYSRYVVAFPIKDMSAETFAEEFYQKFITRFGCVRQIVSDNGKSFKSAYFQKLCAILKIAHRFNSVLTPRAAGQVERYNGTLLGVLRNFINQYQTDWDRKLQQACFAINAAPSSTTGMSAYEMIHGLLPIFPEDFTDVNNLEVYQSVREHFRDILLTQYYAQKIAMKGVLQMNKQMVSQQKTVYDPDIKEGEKVWLYWPKLTETNTKLKLAAVFHGPYYVVSYSTPVTVYLRNAKTGQFIEQPINIRRLKRGLNREKVTEKWSKEMEKLSFDDNLKLDDINLPLDSFELDEETKDILSLGQEEENENENENEDENLHGQDEIMLQKEDVQEPKARRKNSTDFERIYKVLDICRPRGQSVQYYVEFESGEKEWLPRENFNLDAQKMYIEEMAYDEEGIREVPQLRSRSKISE